MFCFVFGNTNREDQKQPQLGSHLIMGATPLMATAPDVAILQCLMLFYCIPSLLCTGSHLQLAPAPGAPGPRVSANTNLRHKLPLSIEIENAFNKERVRVDTFNKYCVSINHSINVKIEEPFSPPITECCPGSGADPAAVMVLITPEKRQHHPVQYSLIAAHLLNSYPGNKIPFLFIVIKSCFESNSF